jgi:hypothetical protein
MRWAAALLLALLGFAAHAAAQTESAGPSSLRVTVNDATDLGLPHAVVAVVDAQGVERSNRADAEGVATFTGLQPGVYQVSARAEGFRSSVLPVTVRRGVNTVTATLAVAIAEQITVADQAADDRRDNGFTQTLTADEIDALSDDPDEMADQLARWPDPERRCSSMAFAADVCRRRIRSNRFASTAIHSQPSTTKPAWCGWK